MLKHALEALPHGHGIMTEEPVACYCKLHSLNYQGRKFLVDGKVVSEDLMCPECRKIADAQEAEVTAQKNAMAEWEKMRQTFRASGIEPEYLDKGFDDYLPQNPSQESALTLCRRFVAGWEKAKAGGFGLTLAGGCGTGKTHLANAIIKALLTSHKIQKAKYVRVGEIIRDVRSAWGGRSEYTEEETIRKYVDLDLLVIDEVGVQAGSENERHILFSVIDRRIAYNRPIICLTNLSSHDLEAILGERLMDRLRSKCVSRFIAGQSFRKPIDESVFD